MNIINRIVCHLMGHKRGKRTGVSSDLGVQLKCGRCKAVWNRKAAPERKAKP